MSTLLFAKWTVHADSMLMSCAPHKVRMLNYMCVVLYAVLHLWSSGMLHLP